MESRQVQSTKYVIDAVAACTTVCTLMQWLPPIAAGLSILWLLYQFATSIYDRFFKE